MQLSKRALANVRKAALGGAVVVVSGVLMGPVGAQSADEDPAVTASTEAPSAQPAETTGPDATTTTSPTPPSTTAPPIDPDDCPGCGLG